MDEISFERAVKCLDAGIVEDMRNMMNCDELR